MKSPSSEPGESSIYKTVLHTLLGKMVDPFIERLEALFIRVKVNGRF